MRNLIFFAEVKHRVFVIVATPVLNKSFSSNRKKKNDCLAELMHLFAAHL